MIVPVRAFGVIIVMALLPVVEANLMSFALSAVGGLVSAAAFFGLLEARNHWRWRQVNHAGATMLLNRSLETTRFIGAELRAVGVTVSQDYPTTTQEYDEFENAWNEHWQLAVREDVLAHLDAFTREAMSIIEVTPRLRDDPLLVDRVFQARVGIPMLMTVVEQLVGEGVQDERVVAPGQRIFWAYTRALRATCIHVQRHIDRKQAQRDRESFQGQLVDVRAKMQGPHQYTRRGEGAPTPPESGTA